MSLLNRKKYKTRYPAFYAFTLIEITLAIGIVAIGMAGIMALFPIGFNATRDAIGDNYSSDFADEFLHIIANQATKSSANWDAWVGPSSTKILTTKPTPPATPSKTGSEILPGSNLYKTTTQGVYYIESKSGDIVDFNAHVAVWKTPVKCTVFEGSWKDWTAPYSDAAGLNVEVSWPADKPYAAREKKYYYSEIFKPLP